MPDGIMIIDKPAGLTSHDVVARLRKLLGTKKIGHTGTLDPFATGVLVMLIGRATRLARFLDQDEKAYEAVLRFGCETDTGDRTGEPRAETRSEDPVEAGELRRVLAEFTGEIEQVPPMYSAKKVKGRKLYELARKGVEIEREPVVVRIPELELTDPPEPGAAEPEAGIRVVCSAGTYIRTLAEDIGRRIGVPCHLEELRRTRAGRFDISGAVTLEELAGLVESGTAHTALVSMNEALAHLPSVVLGPEEIERTRNGMRYPFADDTLPAGADVRMVGPDGELAAVGEYRRSEKFIQPRLVMI